MSNQRTKPWIYIQDTNNIQKIASPEYISQLLGICALKDRVHELENKIAVLEEPLRRKAALDLLRKAGGKHTEKWFMYRSGTYLITYGDLQALVREGKIIQSRAGNHTVYSLREEAKE